MWPPWLTDDIPGLAVWSIQHDSAPTLWRGHAMPLVDRANNLLSLLLTEPRLAQGGISFVAHSFGGIILQQLLRVAADRSPAEPQVAALLRRVRGITFLGTPHHGANLATWARIFWLVVRPSSAVDALATDDSNLRGLNQWFRRYALDTQIPIQTLVETKNTFLIKVVAAHSADPGLPSYPIPLDANHFDIAAPASRTSETYVHLRHFLTEPPTPVSPRGSLPDEFLQRTATRTDSNTTALQRVEQNLAAQVLSPSPSPSLPLALVDAEALRHLTRLKRSRFLYGARPREQASRLARALLHGDLNLASSPTKARILAWCARILIPDVDSPHGPQLLQTARSLADTEEVRIAAAFQRSHSGDLPGALAALSEIGSPAARSAAFISVKNNSGPVEALAWLRRSGLALSDLDSDGRLFLIETQLHESLFDDALTNSVALAPNDFEHAPALSYVAANAHLASVVPRELVGLVLSQPQFTMGAVPLADDDSSLQTRLEAQRLYQRAAVDADDLQCPQAANSARDFALLLRLRNPHGRDAALAELQESMRSPEHSLRRLPIALGVDLPVDLVAVEQEIDREMALSGGASLDASLARLAFAQTRGPEERAAYIREHRGELTAHVNPAFLASVEIQSLVAAGQLHLAQQRIEELASADLSDDDRARLARIVADARASDPTTARERRFAESGSLYDLQLLVDALERNQDWPRLAQYAGTLFQRARDLPRCVLLARSLFETGEFAALVEHVRNHADLLSASASLQSLLAWALYNLGHLRECLEVLAPLRDTRDAREDRELTVGVAIAAGDWHSLAGFVEREWERRTDRSAGELLRAAQIAQQLRLPRARSLITEAAQRADGDAHVLLGCYGAATADGWEDEDTVAWIQQAEALSGSDGPVQRLTLSDLVSRRPDWHEREVEARARLDAAEVPLFAYGRLVNRTLLELLLLPALANAETLDPRGRTPLYTYSGARNLRSGMPPAIAMDPTALVVSAVCGLLERLVGAVDRVVVPHSTLGWLFEEAQRIRFHQPSKIADAHEVRRLLDGGVLQQVEFTVAVDPRLYGEIGEELAHLFAEAGADWSPDQRPRRVVRPRPIHRVTSLMQEEADLGPHVARLCGCLDIIDAFAQQGCLTRAEEDRARTFLARHEIQRSDVSSVVPESLLYLDSLSLSYFQHLRILSKFEASGFTALIGPPAVVEVDRLLQYEALADRAGVIIDHIRGVLATGIAEGKVILASAAAPGDVPEYSLGHPCLHIVRDAVLADVVVIDDRYFNRLTDISHGDDLRTPVWTTYDLLTALGLPEEQHGEYLVRARRAGLAFVPLASAELTALLSRARVADGVLVESAELRAIRENLELCRMSAGLQLPGEAPWLANLSGVLAAAIKGQWRDGVDLADAAARSTWLGELLDVRRWAHRWVEPGREEAYSARYRAQLLALMTFTSEVPDAIRAAYWNWLDQAILAGVRERQPELHDALIADLASVIQGIVERRGDSGENDD